MVDDLELCWLNPATVAPALRPGVEAFWRNLRPTGSLPTVHTSLPVEPYAQLDPVPNKCVNVPALGMALFRRFVLEHLGGGSFGICACRPIAGTDTPSDHSLGMAWDWRVSANDPADVARVNKLLDWLLKPGPNGEPHANFRRVGMRYMIWRGQQFSSLYKVWKPYTGANPHVDHVHFSLGSAGAAAQTSFYQWLQGGSFWWWPYAAGFAVGIGAAYAAVRYV